MCDATKNMTLIKNTLKRQLFIDQNEVDKIPLGRVINHCHFYDETLFFAELERQGCFAIPRDEIPCSLTLLSLQSLVNKYRST